MGWSGLNILHHALLWSIMHDKGFVENNAQLRTIDLLPGMV